MCFSLAQVNTIFARKEEEMGEKLIYILCGIALIVAVWALTHIIVTLRWKGRAAEALAGKKSAEAAIEELRRQNMAIISELKEQHKAHIEELKAQHEKDLEQELAIVKAEMSARTEELLKLREETLTQKAKETFDNISGDLGKGLKDMKEAFESNCRTQLKDAAEMKEKFDSAVKSLEEHSRSIGGKADHLAEALRGQKKLQGCWGETVLANLLNAEGLVEGRDYEKEASLRDELGFLITNEDTEKTMRPDFILHLPDDNDIVIDAKVSLAAYSDYVEAENEQERRESSKRNLLAIREQVKKLAGKSYDKYLRPKHRMLDYTLMFVPNYPALQLAYNEDGKLWREAYSQGVLICSEETLMPFLRMINIAWTNVEQARNQQQIIAAAERMVERVADFAKAHAEMGNKLAEATRYYDSCSEKLKDSGRSIVQSARQVIKLGVPANPKKNLPE